MKQSVCYSKARGTSEKSCVAGLKTILPFPETPSFNLSKMFAVLDYKTCKVKRCTQRNETEV